jgi:hypothetical protein
MLRTNSPPARNGELFSSCLSVMIEIYGFSFRIERSLGSSRNSIPFGFSTERETLGEEMRKTTKKQLFPPYHARYRLLGSMFST